MKSVLVALLLAVSLFAVGCQKNVDNGELTSNPNNSEVNNTTNAETQNTTVEKDYDEVENNPIVTLEIQDLGIVKIELYPQIAPESCENFISLVNSGFYDGLTFHRVKPGFMAQGGAPDGNGTGGPGYGIKGEFSSNSFENNLSHTRGIVSMARSQAPDSAGSQFFIVTTDSTYLDGQYAGFGKVIEGMDVVDKVVNTEVIRREVDEGVTTEAEYLKQYMEIDRPVNPPVITKATVDTFGYTYDEPNKIVEE